MNRLEASGHSHKNTPPRVRVAYLVTHPIQYQAPLLRRLSREDCLDLTVFFCSDFSVSTFEDPEFRARIAWDVPLLEGYKYEFLPAWGGHDHVSFWRPWNHGLARRLQEGQFDVLWVHSYRRWFHLFSMLVARLAGTTVMLRDEATLISSHYGPLKQIAKRALFKVLMKLCDTFLAIGTLNRQYYLHFGVPKQRIVTVPYAVDNDYFQGAANAAQKSREALRSSLGLEPHRPVILYASKLVPRKRPADLLEAYVRLSPDGVKAPVPYLVFIGEGNSRSGLEARTAALGWESIKFLGFKNQTELPQFYDLCDVFVLPSDREPWGLVINEVMNASRAVIVSDRLGCAPDLVRNGENGYVFPAGNVAALSEALLMTVENLDRCRSMGKRSLEIIQAWSFEEDAAALRRAFLQRGSLEGLIPKDSTGAREDMVLSGRDGL